MKFCLKPTSYSTTFSDLNNDCRLINVVPHSHSYLNVSLAGVRVCLVGDGEDDPAEADVLHLVAGDELLLQLHVARDLFSEVSLVTRDRPTGES